MASVSRNPAVTLTLAGRLAFVPTIGVCFLSWANRHAAHRDAAITAATASFPTAERQQKRGIIIRHVYEPGVHGNGHSRSVPGRSPVAFASRASRPARLAAPTRPPPSWRWRASQPLSCMPPSMPRTLRTWHLIAELDAKFSVDR
jgi:hypothetical protein